MMLTPAESGGSVRVSRARRPRSTSIVRAAWARDNYKATGVSSDESDVKHRDSDVKRFVDAVYEMADEHGLWGWCQVEVEAKFATLRGWAYLGACSYAGDDDSSRPSIFAQYQMKHAFCNLRCFKFYHS
jgi:hypothetical protein